MRNKGMFTIFISVFVVVVLAVGIGIFAINNNQKEVKHEYVLSTVVEKYINDGYGGIYFHKGTEYVMVTEYELDNEIRRVTTVVDMSYYNAYDIGDVMYYCVPHNKLKGYES